MGLTPNARQLIIARSRANGSTKAYSATDNPGRKISGLFPLEIQRRKKNRSRTPAEVITKGEYKTL